MGIYLRAEPGAYARGILVAGDPMRISRLAGRLDDCAVVTEHRGLLGYTGYHEGSQVSLQSTGMGCPSMAMVTEELLACGVETIIRIGTCSAFAEGVENGDLIVVTGSAAADGTTRSYAQGYPYVAVPDFELTAALAAAAAAQGAPFHVGPVVTVDVEPHLRDPAAAKWRDHGLLAVEMESATLFYLAMRERARGRNVSAACVLTVSDGLEGHPTGLQAYMDDEALEQATERMHLVALAALTGLYRT
ncbi:MAG: phosphorylase family protein [Acidimicrobiales bacterium]